MEIETERMRAELKAFITNCEDEEFLEKLLTLAKKIKSEKDD